MPCMRAVDGGGFDGGALSGHVERVGFVLSERGVCGAGGGALDPQRGAARLRGLGCDDPDAGLPRDPRHQAIDGAVQARIGNPRGSDGEVFTDCQSAIPGRSHAGHWHQQCQSQSSCEHNLQPYSASLRIQILRYLTGREEE